MTYRCIIGLIVPPREHPSPISLGHNTGSIASSFVIQLSAKDCGEVGSSNVAGSDTVDINVLICVARSSGVRLQGNVGEPEGLIVGSSVEGAGVGTIELVTHVYKRERGGREVMFC